jgi:hypothetical protein
VVCSPKVKSVSVHIIHSCISADGDLISEIKVCRVIQHRFCSVVD